MSSKIEDLKKKLETARDSIRSYREEELDKSFKDLAIGAAMGASILHGHTATSFEDRAPQVAYQHHSVMHDDLRRISMIESSGGKNKNHEMTTVGVNAGHTAGGSTGLMPITIAETVAKTPELKAKYQHLLSMKPDQVTAAINQHPDMETDIANHHWKRLSNVFRNDRPRMAFAWRNGITAAKNATSEQISNHPYVQKFMGLSKAEDPESTPV